MNIEQTIDLMYRAGVNIGAPDIGNRQDFEKLVYSGDIDATTMVAFVSEVCRLHAEMVELEAAIGKQAEADAIFNATIEAML